MGHGIGKRRKKFSQIAPEELQQYAEKMREQEINATEPEFAIHPIYVELQSKSLLCRHQEWNYFHFVEYGNDSQKFEVTDIDFENDPIGIH